MRTWATGLVNHHPEVTIIISIVSIYIYTYKTHGSESQGQEEAASMHPSNHMATTVSNLQVQQL